MRKIATFSDLILLAYNELPKEDRLFLQQEIESNPKMKDDLNGIVSVQKTLNKIEAEPSEDTLSKILGYSAALNCFRLTKPNGDAFVLVN